VIYCYGNKAAVYSANVAARRTTTLLAQSLQEQGYIGYADVSVLSTVKV